MAARVAAGARLEQRRGHDVAAIEHHDPVHRAHEQRVARAPVHATWDRQGIERLLHQSRQQAYRRLARLAAGEVEKTPLALIESLQRLDARAAARGESERRARRRTARIEGAREGWAAGPAALGPVACPP